MSRRRSASSGRWEVPNRVKRKLPRRQTKVRFRHAKLLQVRDLEEGGRCRIMVSEQDVLSRQEQRDDPGHIDLSPPNWTGSQSSFLAQRDEDGRVPLLVSPHPHTSVHDVGHGVRGVLIGLQRRSVGVDPYCMTSNHRWVDAQRRHCKGELMEAEPEAGGEHNGLLGLRGAPKEHLLTVGSGGGIPCTRQ